MIKRDKNLDFCLWHTGNENKKIISLRVDSSNYSKFSKLLLKELFNSKRG